MNNNNGSNINAFLVGLIVGGILGVLFAPDKGEKTRKSLKRSYKKWSKKALDVAQELGEEFGPYAEEAVEMAAPIIQEIRPVSDELAGGDQTCSSCLGEGEQQDLQEQGSSITGQSLSGKVSRAQGEVKKHIPKSRPRFFKGV